MNELARALEEHLETINTNSEEITYLYELLNQMDNQVDKMFQRIESVELFLEKNYQYKITRPPKFELLPLNSMEKEVFIALYLLEKVVYYETLAKKTGLKKHQVVAYITRLKEKGVPIIKKQKNNKICLVLNPYFKQLQAKENILNIEQRRLGAYLR